MAKQNQNTQPRKPRNAQAPAPAPATQAPAPGGLAVSKYTRGYIAHGLTVGGIVVANAQSVYATTANGKPVFTISPTAVCTAKGPHKKLNAGTFAFTLYNAMLGQTPAIGVANLILAIAKNPANLGKVANYAQYSTSYKLLALYLTGNGPHPGSSHAVNVAKHIRNYIATPGSWLQSPAHGNAHWVG